MQTGLIQTYRNSILVLMFLVFAPMNLVYAENCFSPDEEAYWSNIKDREDVEFEKIQLAELRQKLCEEVELGKLTTEQAENLFEFERAKAMDKIKQP